MMCCIKCPFHPITGTESKRCSTPICNHSAHKNGVCSENLGQRCFLDEYVVQRLYQSDQLAVKLAFHSLKTALIGRDRALLLSLFHAACEDLRIEFWEWLEEYEPRSLWLLNPIFTSIGLTSLNSFSGVLNNRDAYLDAIVSNPYVGPGYRSVLADTALAVAGERL